MFEKKDHNTVLLQNGEDTVVLHTENEASHAMLNFFTEGLTQKIATLPFYDDKRNAHEIGINEDVLSVDGQPLMATASFAAQNLYHDMCGNLDAWTVPNYYRLRKRYLASPSYLKKFSSKPDVREKKAYLQEKLDGLKTLI